MGTKSKVSLTYDVSLLGPMLRGEQLDVWFKGKSNWPCRCGRTFRAHYDTEKNIILCNGLRPMTKFEYMKWKAKKLNNKKKKRRR